MNLNLNWKKKPHTSLLTANLKFYFEYFGEKLSVIMGLSCTVLVTNEAISPMSSLLYQLMEPDHSITHNI